MGQKYYWIFAIFALLGIIFISGFIISNQQPTDVTEKGFLQGKVTIGPLCPVERIPPDPKCQPTEETYKAWPIAVYTFYQKIKIAQIEPSLNGTYTLELPVGNYIVDLEKPHMFGSNLPATVIIKKGQITTLNIDMDTGIR